jgi:hypothetical protein
MKKRELKQLASTLARDLREEREKAQIRNGALADLSAKLAKVDDDREYWKALAGVEHDMRLNAEKAGRSAVPFKSEKQRRWLWANRPDLARKWTNEYGSGVSKRKKKRKKKKRSDT